MSRRVTTLVVLLSLALFAAPALAGKGGKNGLTASCSVAGNTVQSTSLPTDQVINFMTTTATGTTGWVLGFTSDGTWSVNVPSPTGPTTYQFVSKTWGPDGSKWTVFASCSG